MSNKLIIGIDPGTNGGWVVMDLDRKIIKIGPKSGELYGQHSCSALNLLSFLVDNHIKIAFVEQQYAGRLSSDALRLGKSEGFWVGIVFNDIDECKMINPNAWRTHFQLHKRTSSYVYKFAKERLGSDLPEHAATAALVATFGIENEILKTENLS